MTTLWADVSEWQRPVDDSYPHRILCIRSNDGTYRDKNWASNYGWCKQAADAGRLDAFIVYLVYRTNWQQTLDTFRAQIGSGHPRLVAMVDVESWGGQIGGNQSAGINALIDGLAETLGDRSRVIAYGNQGDLNGLWPNKPAGIRLIVAGYSMTRPNYPGQIGWQYTDGTGYGPGPQGAAPFGNCDMNQTELSPTDFAAQCGVNGGFLMGLNDDQTQATWRGAAQWAGASKVVRSVSDRLKPFLPKSFSDPNGVWPRDELDALVNEVVWDGYDLTSGAFGYTLLDFPDTEKGNLMTWLRVVAARQQAIRAQLNRIEAKLGAK